MGAPSVSADRARSWSPICTPLEDGSGAREGEVAVAPAAAVVAGPRGDGARAEAGEQGVELGVVREVDVAHGLAPGAPREQAVARLEPRRVDASRRRPLAPGHEALLAAAAALRLPGREHEDPLRRGAPEQ